MTPSVAFLAVRPHPDDESSATGGLLAKYAAAELRTAVVTCTGGEEGEIHDPDLAYEEAFPRLAEIREQELRAACSVLRVSELRLLGYRDSGMAGSEANAHADAFANAALDEAGRHVAAIIRELRPTVVVTEDERGGYGHPDHIMCHRVTVRAWELAADPAMPLAGEPWRPARLYAMTSVTTGWGELLERMRREGLDTAELEPMVERRRKHASHGTPGDVTAAIDVSPFAEIQREALRRHRTQIPPSSFFFSLPPHLLRYAFATAYLTRLYPTPINGERDDDLFP